MSWRFWPPKTIDSSGVSNRNVPLTVTVTVEPADSGQLASEQVRSMSSGWIAIIEPAVSFWIRQTTLLAALHGWPARYSSGVRDAWNAPSRAALFRVIFA